MAGKTFHGVGDFEGESPPLRPEGAAPSPDDESGEAYSGPTVVDDAKIAESLQRLRSLDQPLAPAAGGVSMSVMDAGSAEPTRIADGPLSPPAVATAEPIAAKSGPIA